MHDLSSLLGSRLDSKYRLDEKLGQGGMGTVFRATHLGTDRVVALKLIAPGLMDQEEFVQRFQREARATGRLRHPNIVDLTDFGFAEVEGQKLAYLVMEFLEGESLADLLRRNPQPPLSFIVETIQQVCSALQEAHDAGIVHRDLKPDNLWLEPDRRGGQRVKILDFGLAKIYDPKARAEGKPGLPLEEPPDPASVLSRLMTEALPPDRAAASGSTADGPLNTAVGTRLGTPAYMSPEQCRGASLDHRSDLYSLGVIIYQMLSGHPPFKGDSLELLNQHIQSDVPQLRRACPDLPPGVAELVMECLSKDPSKRPATAEILGNALEAFAEDTRTLFKKSLGLYVDLFAAHWTRFLKPFLLPLLCAGMLLALGWYLERPLGQPGGPTERQAGAIVLQALTYWGALAGVWFGALIHAYLGLAGSITPLVLRKLLKPLAPFDAETQDRDRLRLHGYRRYVWFTSLAVSAVLVLLCLTNGWTIRWLATTKPSHSAMWTIAFMALSINLLLPLALIFLQYRLRGFGGSEYGMASVLFMEGKSLAEGRARIQHLLERVRAYIPAETWEWGLRPSKYASRRKQVVAGPVNLIWGWTGFIVGTSVCVGMKLWDRFLPPDVHFGVLAFAAWWVLWCTLLLAVLAPLSGIFSALTYLRVRKIARESMKEAFEGFEERLSGLARSQGA